MGNPTLADLQAVPLAAWAGLIRARMAGLVRAADHDAAEAEGFSKQSMADGGVVSLTTPKGSRYLSALWALVDGLTSEQSRVLALTEAYKSDGPFRRRYEMPAWAGAWRSGNYFASTNLGRAALLLLEVSRG